MTTNHTWRPFSSLLACVLVHSAGCRAVDDGSGTSGDGDGDEPSAMLLRADGSAIDFASEPVPLGARVHLQFAAPVAAEVQGSVEAEIALLGPNDEFIQTRSVWSDDGAELLIIPRGLLDPRTDYRLHAGGAPLIEFRTKLHSDFDGDGFADLVIAAPGRALGGVIGVGAVMVHHGSIDGVGSTPTLVLDGVGDAEESFGTSHTAIDLDGDGFDDLVIGALGRGGFTGAVEVRYGGPSGLSSVADETLSGEVSGETFGARVSAIGDVNADGFEDLAIAAPRAESGGQANVGRVDVHFGAADGITAAPPLGLEGDGGSGEFGTWMTGGDFDDDGFDDLVVCAPNHEQARGLARVLPGSDDGPILDPAAVVTLVGENPGDGFCTQPAVADVDGDGIDDLAIGVIGWLEGVGGVAVYPGSPDGIDAAVFDRLVGDAQPDLFGLVTSAGDLDGDGDAELLIGAPYATAGARDGLVYVHEGGPTGPAQIPTTVWMGSGAELFGLVHRPLDLDGDGWPEAIIAAPGFAGQTGRVAIYPGGGGQFATIPALVIEGQTTEDRLGDYLPPT